MSIAFPFSAIVGQDEMKQALLIAAVDPSIGGVLILGDRGTGKSTGIRGLAALLPAMRVVEGCAYNADPAQPAARCSDQCVACTRKRKSRDITVPVIDLPLGATEDRVVGALDLERALTRGEKSIEPGLLARANRGFLYIDEVNLLEDHLVDLLLDVAASGENVVEREGLSIRHPARFVLVGSGNPEEGELRPQLLDRFGLSLEVTTTTDIDDRMEVIRRRDAFERNPKAFVRKWAAADAQIRDQISAAKVLVAKVTTPAAVMRRASELCIALGTDGLRGELTLIRAARAAAALAGDKKVTETHLKDIAPSALRHRLRRDPLDDTGSTTRVERALQQVFGK